MGVQTEILPFPATICWPKRASVIGANHPHLVLEALLDSEFVAYIGWYVDSPTNGPVWHRWKRDSPRTAAGVALLSAIYSLASRGVLEVHFSTDRSTNWSEERVFLRRAEKTSGDSEVLSLVEEKIAAILKEDEKLRFCDLLNELFTQSQNVKEWLKKYHLVKQEFNPQNVIEALRLAMAFIELYSSYEDSDVSDDFEEAIDEIEWTVFKTLKRLRAGWFWSLG